MFKAEKIKNFEEIKNSSYELNENIKQIEKGLLKLYSIYSPFNLNNNIKFLRDMNIFPDLISMQSIVQCFSFFVNNYDKCLLENNSIIIIEVESFVNYFMFIVISSILGIQYFENVNIRNRISFKCILKNLIKRIMEGEVFNNIVKCNPSIKVCFNNYILNN